MVKGFSQAQARNHNICLQIENVAPLGLSHGGSFLNHQLAFIGIKGRHHAFGQRQLVFGVANRKTSGFMCPSRAGLGSVLNLR